MRLPRVIASGNVQQTAAPPYASPEAFGVSYGAAVRGAERLGQAVATFNDTLLKERATERVSQLFLDASRAVDDLNIDLEREPDAATHFERWERGWKGIRARVEREAGGQPFVRQELARRLDQLGLVRGHEAKWKGQTRFVAEAAGKLDGDLLDLARMAAEAESPLGAQFFSGMAQQRLDAAERLGVITPAARVARQQMFADKIAETRALALVEGDPLAAFARLGERNGEFAGMDPEKRMRLLSVARARYDSLVKEAERRERDETKRQQDELAMELRVKMYEGADVQEQVNMFRRALGEDQHKTLLALNHALVREREREKAERVHRSDGPTLLRLEADILAGRLRSLPLAERRVSALVEAGVITGKDGIAALKLLTGEEERRERKTESERDKLTTRGLEVIRRRLALAGPLEFDSASEELIAAAEIEFLKGLRANQKRHPLDYADRIATTYARAILDRKETDVFGRLLPSRYQTENDVLADFEAGRITREESDRYLRLLQRVDEQRRYAPPRPKSNRQPKAKETR